MEYNSKTYKNYEDFKPQLESIGRYGYIFITTILHIRLILPRRVRCDPFYWPGAAHRVAPQGAAYIIPGDQSNKKDHA